MSSSGLGSSRRRLTRGGVVLGTDPVSCGGVIAGRYKYHGHTEHPSGIARINAGEPLDLNSISTTPLKGAGLERMDTPAGNKAKQEEVYKEISKIFGSSGTMHRSSRR